MSAPTVRRFPRTLADAFPDVRASSGDWERMVNFKMKEKPMRCVSNQCNSGRIDCPTPDECDDDPSIIEKVLVSAIVLMSVVVVGSILAYLCVGVFA